MYVGGSKSERKPSGREVYGGKRLKQGRAKRRVS